MLSTLCLTWDDLDLLVTIPMKGCAIRRTRPLDLIYCGNLAIILTASTQMTQKKRLHSPLNGGLRSRESLRYHAYRLVSPFRR